jgi:predicted porin
MTRFVMWPLRVTAAGEMSMGLAEARCRHLPIALLAAVACLPRPAVAQGVAELRAMIEAQRQQLAEQARLLERLEERLDELESAAEEAREEAESAAEVVDSKPVVTSDDTGIALTISGQINRMVTAGYDGDRTRLYHVDNNNSSSRLRVEGSAEPAAEVSLGTRFEFEVQPNPSTEVSQRDQNLGTAEFTDRLVEAYVEHEAYGRLTIGKGSTAADGTPEVDLSGTTVVATSRVEDTAGGLLFYDRDLDALGDTTIGDVFDNFRGLSRQNRLRYDTPSLAGFTIAVDAIADARWSTALRWSGEDEAFQAAAAIGYADPGGNRDWIISSSASVLHEPTGLSLTFALSGRDNPGRDDAASLYGKLGWQRDFFDFGRTHFSIDHARNDDVAAAGDEARSIGVAAVQDIEDYGIELYGSYRFHALDRPGSNFADIHTFSLGTRVRF